MARRNVSRSANNNGNNNNNNNRMLGARKNNAPKRRRQRVVTRRQGIMQSIGAVQQKQLTPQGFKWMLAALHPCGEANVDAVGLPDENHLPTHCVRTQKTATISPPDGNCGATGNLDSCTYNMCVVTPPWPEIAFVVCVTKGSEEPVPWDEYLKDRAPGHDNRFHNGDAATVFNYGSWYFFPHQRFWDRNQPIPPNGNPNLLRNQYQKCRIVGKGTTTYLNASRLNDGGRVITGQYPCAGKWTDVTDPATLQVDPNDILEIVRAALCVKTGASIDEIRAAAAHDHLVPESIMSHAHDLIMKDLDHYHDIPTLGVEPHDHNVSHRHAHGVPHADAKVELTMEPHSHSATSVHQHRVSVSGKLEANKLAHRHLTNLPDHDHECNQTTFAHSHGCTSDEPTRCHPNWEFGLVTEYAGAATIYTDTSLNVNVPIEASGTTDFQSDSNVDVSSTVVKGTGKLASHLNTTFDQMDVKTTLTPLKTDPGKSSGLQGGQQTVPTSTENITIPAKVTGPAQWTSQERRAPTCSELVNKEEVGKLTKVKIIRDNDAVDFPDWRFSEPPVTENQLFYGDPKATTWPARKGTYQVLRLENTELEDCMSGAVSFYGLTDNDVQIAPENYGESFYVNTVGCGTYAVTYYRNISKASSVTLKNVQYTQGVVNPAGPFANLTPMQIEPDKIALDMVAKRNKAMNQAYYASYNDLGTILGDIFNVVKSVGKGLKGLAGEVTGVPVIGDIAKTVAGLLGGLGL